jgi:hypothetical protein
MGLDPKCGMPFGRMSAVAASGRFGVVGWTARSESSNPSHVLACFSSCGSLSVPDFLASRVSKLKSMLSASLAGFRLRRERAILAVDVDDDSVDNGLALLSAEDQANGRRTSVWRTVYRSAPNKSEARGGGMMCVQVQSSMIPQVRTQQ